MAITRPAQVMRKTVLNSRGHVTLVFSHQLNSKSNGPIFFKTIIRQRNCFLSSGLQGWTRVLMLSLPKSPDKIIMVVFMLYLGSVMKFVPYFLLYSTGHFLCVKALGNDIST